MAYFKDEGSDLDAGNFLLSFAVIIWIFSIVWFVLNMMNLTNNFKCGSQPIVVRCTVLPRIMEHATVIRESPKNKRSNENVVVRYYKFE